MSNLSSPPDDGNTAAEDPQYQDLSTEWQYARLRLARLKADPALRRELVIVCIALALIFAAPALSWIRRWTLSPSYQLYALLIMPLCAAWVWIARRRLVAPEVARIRNQLRLERQMRMMPREIGEHATTVLDVLINQAPIRDRRSGLLLYAAIVLDAVAFWIQDPSLTCVGFIVTCSGIVLYRHGKMALRAALFPILFMLAMVPLPGTLQDALTDRAQPALLNQVEHMVNNVKQIATVPAEGDPINVGTGTNMYQFFAERAGLCISGSILVLVFGIFYLSLIRTSNVLPKIAVVVATSIVCCSLIYARLILLCVIGAYDKESAAFMEILTTYLVYLLDFGFLYLFIRGFKCVKYHRWVSLSLRF